MQMRLVRCEADQLSVKPVPNLLALSVLSKVVFGQGLA